MSKKNFTSMLKELENCKDITPVIKAQKSTLLRFEETNEMLRQFMQLSNSTHSMLLENYTSHVKTLVDLKKNLESSFRRIRTLKVKLKEKYPDAFEATSAAIKELEEKHLHDDEERFDKAKVSNDAENVLPEDVSTQKKECENIIANVGPQKTETVDQSVDIKIDLNSKEIPSGLENSSNLELEKRLENIYLSDNATDI